MEVIVIMLWPLTLYKRVSATVVEDNDLYSRVVSWWAEEVGLGAAAMSHEAPLQSCMHCLYTASRSSFVGL